MWAYLPAKHTVGGWVKKSFYVMHGQWQTSVKSCNFFQKQKTMIADEEDADVNDDEDHRHVL